MRFHSLVSISLILGALIVTACSTQHITAEEIVQRMEATRDAMDDAHMVVTVDFVTDQHNGNLTVEGWLKKTHRTDTDGKLINKVRAVVRAASETDLQDSLLVSDGERFWFYNPVKNTVFTGTQADMPSQSLTEPAGATEALQDLIERGLDATNVTMLGEEQIAGQDTWKLKVTPKLETEQQFQLDGIIEATMWVDKERVLPLKLDVDASDMGQGTIEVRTIETDSGLDDTLFTFTIPDGAKVVQAAEWTAQTKPHAVTLADARSAVSFPLLAPETLPRQAVLIEVQLIGTETVIQNYAAGSMTFSVVQSRDDGENERQPPVGSAIQEITVRSQTGTLITGSDPRQGSLLRWSEKGVRIIVAGTLNAEEALTVAESLK